MQPQNGIGPHIPLAPSPQPGGGIYLAQVVAVDPADHAVQVLLPGLSPLINSMRASSFKAHVLEHRAGSYVGDLDLPRVGDWGLVVFPSGTDQYAVWLGSLYQDLSNLAWEGKQPADRLDHHDSGVYALLDAAGNLDWVHPSGTRVRVGTGTAAAARQRQEAQGETRRTVAYAIPTKAAVSVHVEHSSGTLLTIDPSGNLTVTGVGTKAETIDGAVTEDYKSTKSETVEGNLTEAYQGTKQETVAGGVTESYEDSWILSVGANGSVTVVGSLTITADDLTLASSNPSPGPHMHMGGASGEDWIALKAALDKIKTAFDAHVHSGVQAGGSNTGTPTAAMPAYVQDADYTGQTKAT